MIKKNILKTAVYVALISIFNNFQNSFTMELQMALDLDSVVVDYYQLKNDMNVKNYKNIITPGNIQEYNNSINDVLQTKLNSSFNKDTAKKLYSEISKKIVLMPDIATRIGTSINKYERSNNELLQDIRYYRGRILAIEKQIKDLNREKIELNNSLINLNKTYKEECKPLLKIYNSAKEYLLSYNILYQQYNKLEKMVKKNSFKQQK